MGQKRTASVELSGDDVKVIKPDGGAAVKPVPVVTPFQQRVYDCISKIPKGTPL
jgi:hypothetical protein